MLGIQNLKCTCQTWCSIDTNTYIPEAHVTMHDNDLTLIKLTVARFVGIGSFLILYSNGHTK